MTKQHRHTGDNIKALQDNRVGGYLVRFTNANDRDLYKEWFDKDTDLWLERGWPVKGNPVLLEHGLEDFAKVMPIGLIDMVKEDEFGLYVEAKLNDRAKYEEMLAQTSKRYGLKLSDSEISQKAELAVKAIQAIVETGKVGWSSGALPQGVSVSEDGHIDSWPIIEGSLTFTPAEPDGTEIAPIKSALAQLSDFMFSSNELSTPAPTSKDAQHIENEADKHHMLGTDYGTSTGNTASVVWTLSNGGTLTTKSTTKGTIEMDFLEKLLAMIQEYMANQGGDAAMASAVEEEIRAEVPEEELAKAMEDDTLAEKIAEKALQIADARLLKRQASTKAVDKVFDARIKALERNAEPKDPYGAGGSLRGNPRNPIEQITEYTPYTHWKAEDYSFAIGLAEMSQRTAKKLDFKPDQRFFREFADKAEKRLREGSLKLDMKAMKGIYAIKSDELDYSTQAGYGDEWVPTVWADNIWERPRLENVVQNLFGSVEMPSNPYEYPVESADPTVYLVAETKNESALALDISGSPIPDSKVATSKVTFTAAKLGLRVMYSSELQEDGIARLVPKFRQQSERAMLDAIDYVAINGDTNTTLNVNSDGETITDTTRRYLAYNGMIKQAIVTATTNRLDAASASPSLTLLRSTRALLGSAEGYNPENLAWIMDFPTYIKLLNDDVVITVDKYGAAATVITGELGRIDGIRVFVSGQMALADSDGKITQTSNVVNRGRAILVHVPTWLFGYRRRIVQSLDFIPWAEAWSLIITMRNHFVPRTAANGTLQSTDDSTAVLFNLGV